MTEEWLFGQKPVPPDAGWYEAVKKEWDRIAKPLDGFGQFETVTAQIGAIRHRAQPSVEKRAVLVFCADNGIVEEGISQSGQEVTQTVAANMGKGITTVCKMAKKAGVKVFPVDIGINCDVPIPGVENKKVAKGTANFAKTPAMTKKQALQAVAVGMELVKRCAEQQYGLVGIGEMGIGNTTTSSAVAAALLGRPVREMTGRGAGLSDSGLRHKTAVIEKALEKYGFTPAQAEKGDTPAEAAPAGDTLLGDTLRILADVGGFDIAGMAGACIGGALYGIPVVLDGVISMVAALTAERLVPGVKDYLIASHVSREPAAGAIARALALHPVIDAGMALGEGTGAVMLFALLDLVMAVYGEQTTFEDIRLEQYVRFDGKES